MTKSELIERLADKLDHLAAKDVEQAIKEILEMMAHTLSKGERIEIRGFGRWYCKKLKENFNARNPATNELIYKPERVKIRFRASKKLNKIINE